MPIEITFVTLNFFDSTIDFLDKIYSWFLSLMDSIVTLFGLVRSFFALPT